MLIRKSSGARRSGSTIVETTFVIVMVLMIIMGIFEFGRMLMVWNLLDNAARTGCRYALANNTSSTIASDTTTMVTGGTLANGTVVPNRMAGQNTAAFTSFTVTVSGVHNGVTYTGNGVNTLVAGDMITVTVTGTYNFMNIIPFLHMGTMTMTSAPTMVCEGVN